MTEASRPSFLGVPIYGEARGGENRPEQWSREQFEIMFAAMLDEPFFLEFGWTQYTPYFNDGEPCIFSVQGTWVRTVGQEELNGEGDDAEEADYDNIQDSRLDISGYGLHGTLGGQEINYRGAHREVVYRGEREELYHKAYQFTSALNRGNFDNVVIGLFGDHTEITVRRTGITIESYSHE